jgi:hypothetical protein
MENNKHEVNKNDTDAVNKDKASKQDFDEGEFNLSELRLSQNFLEMAGVKKVITTIPVRKPGRQDFFRVHSSPDYYLETAVLEYKQERETYLVDRGLWSELPGEIIAKVLFTVINRQNILSIWTVRLPGADGRLDHWNQSALEAAEIAKKQWVRMGSNMNLGAYEVFLPTAEFSDPVWPDVTFQEMLKIAFKDKFIRDFNHPLLCQLRGEI